MEAPLVEAKPALPAHLSHESVPCSAYICQFLGILGACMIYFSVFIFDINAFIGGFGSAFVFLYVVELFICKTFRYLGHVCSEADFSKLYARMRGADPSMVFKGKNFITLYDGSVEDKDTFEMPYEIAGSVNESMAEAEFKATCSGDGGGRSVITLHLPLTVTPVDEPTRKHYSDTRTNFAASHKDEKCEQSIVDVVTLDGHEEFYLVVMGGDGTVPMWMKRSVFILCSVIPFTTILYRLTLFRMTQSLEIPITKRFSVRIAP